MHFHSFCCFYAGAPISDASISGATKGSINLVERLGTATASTSQAASSSNATALNINASSSNVGVQNVQVSWVVSFSSQTTIKGRGVDKEMATDCPSWFKMEFKFSSYLR